jgi:uncharacterized protein YjiS (DUF1127 family)
MLTHTMVPTQSAEKQSRMSRQFARQPLEIIDMNTVIDAYHQSSSFPAIGALSQMIGRGMRFVNRASRMRRGRAQLYKMSDHILKDIGISRSEILSVTRFREIDSTRRQRY